MTLFRPGDLAVYPTYGVGRIQSIESRSMGESRIDCYVVSILSDNSKVFVPIDTAEQMGLRTLIIVPTSGIKVQWGETLTGMFKVPPERVVVVNKPKDFINVKAD
ncbi:hypothetical protein J5834_04900, partial [bacterium]|nr:hypothetical protein [bacterium]